MHGKQGKHLWVLHLSRALLRTLTTLIKCHTNTAIVVRDESGIIFSHCRLDFKVPEMLSELQNVI